MNIFFIYNFIVTEATTRGSTSNQESKGAVAAKQPEKEEPIDVIG